MKSKESDAPTKISTRRPAHQRGKGKVFAKPLGNTIAVRYREAAGETVYAKLHALGQVRAIEPQRLFIVEFPKARRAAAEKQLQQWMGEGTIEFFTTVLRDEDSQLRQIPTDEITVRFKAALPPRRLKTLEKKYGVTVARQNEFVPNQFILKVAQPSGLRTLEVASRLDAADDVEFAEPNFISEFRRS